MPRVILWVNAPGAVEPPSEPTVPSRLEPGGGVGTNDVRDIASGVHFVHSTIDNRQSQTARVVLTR